jgi:ABC-2 type transport system permease protein
MITDILTIIWKEAKELFLQRGILRGGRLGVAIFMVAFGVLLPLQTGREWVSSPIGLVFWGWLPFMLVGTVVADTFAGERERHTLETLLASRLTDRAILFGKIATSVLYGWGLTMISVLLSLITVNVVYGKAGLLLYPFDIALSIVAISLLVALLGSGLGVLISLRASTVRQAQQIFSVMNLVFFLPVFVLPALPQDMRSKVAQGLSGTSATTLIAALVIVLALVDVLLVAAAMARFQRAKLILD